MAIIYPFRNPIKIQSQIPGVKEIFYFDNIITLICDSEEKAKSIASTINMISPEIFSSIENNVPKVNCQKNHVEIQSITNNHNKFMELINTKLNQEIISSSASLNIQSPPQIKTPQRTCTIL